MDGWMGLVIFVGSPVTLKKNESRDTSGLVEFDFASTIFGLNFSGQKR